jgi:hypothetical protein
MNVTAGPILRIRRASSRTSLLPQNCLATPYQASILILHALASQQHLPSEYYDREGAFTGRVD